MQKKVAAIYPLAPLQQMFLWHSLQHSSKAGLLHLQCELWGEVDVDRLHKSWNHVVERYPALRTSIHWEKVKQPLQVVEQQTTLPWQYLNWCDRVGASSDLQMWLEQDYEQGFDLTQSPILRVCLIHLENNRYQLICSTHHIMLDGWSGFIVLNQVFECYQALSQGQLPSKDIITPYQSHIRWLKAQDQEVAEQFWKKQLRGAVASPQWFEFQDQALASAEAQSFSISLSAEENYKLKDFLRSKNLTLSSLFIGIWSLILHLHSDKTDVIFGMTVSGRQGNLLGVESIVGLLSNILPVRVQTDLAESTVSWLTHLQVSQAKASLHSYVSPTKFQEWSGQNQTLFNSLLVIENHQSLTFPQLRDLQIRDIQSGIISNYDLSIIVKPQKESLSFSLQTKYPPIDSMLLAKVGLQVYSLLIKICEEPQSTVEKWIEIERESLLTSEQEESSHRKSKSQFNAHEILNRIEESRKTILPQNDIEEKLLEIWESILPVSPISTNHSFFSLGGSSLSAARLFAQIEYRFHVKLPLSKLFEAPSILELAHVLKLLSTESELERHNGSSSINKPRQSEPTVSEQVKISASQIASWRKAQSLVPIQPKGKKQPFYFVPGGKGGIDEEWITYGKLLFALGAEQPIYGLRARGLEHQTACHESIQAMAKDYIHEIQSMQPNGPYFLGGECIGGIVAYEIAQQLEVQGETVKSLLLLDTDPNITNFQRLSHQLAERLFILKALDYLQYLKTLSKREALSKVVAQFKRRMRRKQRSNISLPIRQDRNDHQRQVSQNYKTVALNYQLQPYSGQLVVITTFRLSTKRKQKQWKALAQSQVIFHELSSDHRAYIREESDKTVEVMQKYLP